MKKYFFAALLLLSCLMLSLSTFAQNVGRDRDARLNEIADSLHKVMFSIDTHVDSASHLNHPDAKGYTVTKGQVTFPKMKAGGLDACFFAIYKGQGPLDDASSQKAVDFAFNEIKLFKEYMAKHSDECGQAWCADDFWKLKKEGKSIVMLTLENGYVLGKDINNLRKFYNEGCRAMTLTHNYNNDLCDGSRDSVEHWRGLSPFGKAVVDTMNVLGMIVDVSHVTTASLLDAVACSKAPCVATHSGVWNIKNHPRNLKDEEIKAIAAKGGLIQIGSGRFFLSWRPKTEVSVKDYVDHVEYVRDLVGIEYVGIGTDFDGGGGMNGLEDCSQMKNITVEMLRRGWSHNDIKLFWGENLLRVMRVVEAKGRELSGAAALR